MREFGRIDAVVNNAAYQVTYSLDEATDEEWNRTFDTNIGAMLEIVRSTVGNI
ncbi:SDR family NAD(P)-dependent oxidoreductase [Paraburkholderia sp. XV]|uniref:SDR family NAD(P)-dependent oxidoreductase n=1 Tax=Paraburkholderia sp. XV TaxID=2831520 RepID=UPI003990DB4B